MFRRQNRLQQLHEQWVAQWPEALAIWSRFVQLHQPAWCLNAADEKREQLSDSFAMIRLNDHSIVISLRQVKKRGLERFGREILAHEIGHHVYCPADLTDNARLLARIGRGLPTLEHLAPFVANLYSDLLINDRLQRIAELDIAGVYVALGGQCKERMWTLYMRIYELLWRLEPGRLAQGEVDQRLNQDAQLGARLIRSYAKDWLDGAGRFAALCFPYLMKDEAGKLKLVLAPWHDTRCAGSGAVPDGLVEIDPQEGLGAIHPAEDPELSGLDAPSEQTADLDQLRESQGAVGVKSIKTYRQPFEYTALLKAAGVDVLEAELVARYYRERAIPYLVPFPVRELPEATDPIPEGTELWDVDSPVEQIDWLATLLASPLVIPGVTTRERIMGHGPGQDAAKLPIDLYLGVDCSGSMGNPGHDLSFPVLAGAIIAISALRSGARAKVVLSGEPGRSLSTDGFIRDPSAILRTITTYLGTGYAFGIHRLAETFENWPPTARPVHLLIVSDNDLFSMLDETGGGALGWDVARSALQQARGGGTLVLELPQYMRQHGTGYLERLRQDGWNVNIVSSMEELIEFARRFNREHH